MSGGGGCEPSRGAEAAARRALYVRPRRSSVLPPAGPARPSSFAPVLLVGAQTTSGDLRGRWTDGDFGLRPDAGACANVALPFGGAAVRGVSSRPVPTRSGYR